MLRLIAWLALYFCISVAAGAQELSFSHDDLSDAAAIDAAMPVLTKEIIASYHDEIIDDWEHGYPILRTPWDRNRARREALTELNPSS